MIRRLSRRETIVVAGIVLAVMLAGWAFVVLPLRDRNDATAAKVPVRVRTLAKRQELLAQKEGIAQELMATNARIESVAARLFTAATPAVAASELQKLVKDMASAATTDIRSERILPPVERGELLEIPIEIAVSGEIRNLVDLLSRLDTAGKVLTVQDLKVRVMNMAQPKDLLATLTISGYIIPARPKA